SKPGGNTGASTRSNGGASGGGGKPADSCPLNNSFTPGTKVLMADGTTTPIEQVKPGDTVIATDPETGTTSIETVTATITGDGVKHLVTITIDTDGQHGPETAEITATDGHPFWVPELDQWIDATHLQPGQWLHTSTGTWVQITAIHRRTVPRAVVYNLTISHVHTYHVVAGDMPVLVHNSSCELEGARDHDVYDPESGNRITDIDHIDGGVLWEEKSAIFGDESWMAKHVDKKLGAYIRARQHLGGYENAPIGFRFTRPGVDPRFRSALQERFARLRQEHPGLDLRLEFAE
ncbi:polymorphic toxin-type HINT domain-containing protein, partial [Micromonospora sp. LOL_014]|uniref:polymorphic toxin-type HINT domain-containing protein n=1 Tax=Micromonospora sp. LOL_014 TaxID=3345415 RepID=UPI003A8B046D